MQFQDEMRFIVLKQQTSPLIRGFLVTDKWHGNIAGGNTIHIGQAGTF